MSERPIYTDLETVFEGPYPEAFTLQASLSAAGYDTFLPDQQMKAIDPFATGINPLWAKLLAPAAVAEEVREAIRQMKDGSLSLSEEDPPSS